MLLGHKSMKPQSHRAKKFILDKDQHAYKWVIFSPGFALLGQSAKSDARHCCSSTPPCGKTTQNRLIIEFQAAQRLVM